MSKLLLDNFLSNLFADIELIVNSRPLTLIAFNPTGEGQLTPNYLLLLGSPAHHSTDIFTSNTVIYVNVVVRFNTSQNSFGYIGSVNIFKLFKPGFNSKSHNRTSASETLFFFVMILLKRGKWLLPST